MTTDRWTVLLLATTALHAGFQVTVTSVVYPALVRVPADRWGDAHARHSRGITPIVAMAYGATLVACAGATLSGPVTGTVTGPGPGVWVADVGTVFAVLLTALLAAPTHGRLTAEPEPALLRSLLYVDRLRCAAAVLALAGAAAAALA